MRATRSTLGSRGFGFILVLTLLIILTGSAGILFFEQPPEGGINTFGDALWWTAMLMTTTGSDYWPKTAEGRILTFLLSLYAYSIFGYITAAIASWLIQKGQSPTK